MAAPAPTEPPRFTALAEDRIRGRLQQLCRLLGARHKDLEGTQCTKTAKLVVEWHTRVVMLYYLLDKSHAATALQASKCARELPKIQLCYRKARRDAPGENARPAQAAACAWEVIYTEAVVALEMWRNQVGAPPESPGAASTGRPGPWADTTSAR